VAFQRASPHPQHTLIDKKVEEAEEEEVPYVEGAFM